MPNQLPADQFKLARQYLKGVKGNAQIITIQKARSIITENKDQEQVKRALKVLKTLKVDAGLSNEATVATADTMEVA